MLSVGALASLAQALFFAGDLDETRRIALEAVERPDAPDVPDGYVGSLGLLALVDAEQGRTESAEAWARQAISFARERFQADSWGSTGASRAGAGVRRDGAPRRGRARGAPRRATATITAAHRRPRPRAARTRAGPRLARSRLVRAARDLERAQRVIAEFPDPGRLPAIAATIEHDLVDGPSERGNAVDVVEEPSPAELAVFARPRDRSLPPRDRRAALHLAEHRQESHARAVPQAGRNIATEAVARAEALGLLEPAQSPG